MRSITVTLLCALGVAPPVVAQQWDDAATRRFIERAIARRAKVQADSTLRDFRARAHGFVLFLGQLGEGLAEPPRLIKSDELVLEVYWKAPGLSKQRIVGWRDRIDLPTDIRYHRDHLGIVQNNFSDLIRLGHGDEVRDVPHPLAPNGPQLYEYALVDSLTIRLPERQVRVYEVTVRPKAFSQPRVLGSLFLDAATAELVVFRFSFTRGAYLDDTLEDISIVLENGLWEGRYWLPRRQEVEIRRRTKWLDLPARGIIRGRWEIRDYRFNLGLADSVFRGPEVVAATNAVRDTFPWDQPLTAAIREMAGPATQLDLETVRAEIGAIAGPHVVSGLAAARLGVGAVSDIIHFNRVEGIALGAGWILRPGGGPAELRVHGGYGVGDERFKGRASVGYQGQRATVTLAGGRVVRDVGDEPVIAPLLNSVLAQEAGEDYGDYVLRDFAELRLERRFGARHALSLAAGVERTTSLGNVAAPATGTFRPNPPLGSGEFAVGRLLVERRSPELALGGGVSGSIAVEGGRGEGRRYVRVRGATRLQVPIGATEIVARGWGGWASREAPVHRAFVMGGRGTLVADPFRAWGGRRAALGALEWRVPVPFPALQLGPFLSTGNRIVLAPFAAAGWTGDPIAGMPWGPTGEVRPVFGMGIEWFHRLLRVEGGVNLDGDIGVTVDLGRDLWGIL
jgi:hypothetical protein